LGGSGRQISEFKVSLIYKESSRTAMGYTEKSCPETKQKNQTNKQTKMNCTI
jgi:predicted RNA-binding protein with PIN domain